jgi:hypothetical protein
MTDPIDDEKPMSTQEYLAYLRNRPPHPGVTDSKRWGREGPGPLHEGFAEDVRRMRRGLPPKWPQN